MSADLIDRSRLSSALRENWEDALSDRQTRDMLISVYESKTESWKRLFPDEYEDANEKPLVNNFVQFVRGHILSLAFGLPKWMVAARNANATGLAFRSELMLTRLTELLEFRKLMKKWALDSAFGRAIAKTCIGIAPKGVNSPVAPRTYRVSPKFFLYDRTAHSIDESPWFGDVYLVSRTEAENFPHFDPVIRYELNEWTENSETRMIPEGTDQRYFVEPMTRLVDVYFPSQNAIYTWPCHNDSFSEVSSLPPLQVRKTPINPYSIMQLTMVPDKPDDYALLETLLPAHLGSNDLLKKGLEQAKLSKRNPMYGLGAVEDIDNLMDAPDGEAVGVEDPQQIGLYQFPGPDPSVVSMGSMLLGLFSQFGGNIEVALGQSAGADTARQTQALMGQLNALQSVARTEFEVFLSDIGKKLITLGFHDQTFKMNTQATIPGTTYSVNVGWDPSPAMRLGEVSDLHLEVTPYSTAFRQPQEKLMQLQQASQIYTQWLMLKAQGLPVNVDKIATSLERTFDLIPELREWWSGEEVEPTPQEKATNTYHSMAGNKGPSQREITYQGANQGSGASQPPSAPPEGGLSGFGE